MWRVLLVAFLLVHAAIHQAIWATPAPKDPTFPSTRGAPGCSATSGPWATVLALVAAVLLAAAGIGLGVHAGWWRPVAVATLAVSLG